MEEEPRYYYMRGCNGIRMKTQCRKPIIIIIIIVTGRHGRANAVRAGILMIPFAFRPSHDFTTAKIDFHFHFSPRLRNVVYDARARPQRVHDYTVCTNFKRTRQKRNAYTMFRLKTCVFLDCRFVYEVVEYLIFL